MKHIQSSVALSVLSILNNRKHSLCIQTAFLQATETVVCATIKKEKKEKGFLLKQQNLLVQVVF